MSSPLNLASLAQRPVPTVTDSVFDTLYQSIVSLDLPPGTKISEAEVSRQLNVSRQPVRDAFFRLSQLGLILVRPQRATTVTKIVPTSVLQARYIRLAIELETVRIAAAQLTEAQTDSLGDLLDRQQLAIDGREKTLFHALDDEFHRKIFEFSDKAFAWDLVREKKAHMDRVRYISLEFGAQSALDDHRVILAAIRANDPEEAAARMKLHLSRIEGILSVAVVEQSELFDES